MERSNFIDIQSQVQILDKLFQEHINNVKEANAVYTLLATTTKNLFPSTIINSAKTINTVLTNTNNTIVKQNNTLKTNVQAILNQAKSYQGLAKQKEQALRQAERERQQVEKLNNAYNRISELMKRASAEYNNLAARKNFGIQLTQKEEARYTQLQARIERFNGVLKKTDADIGKFSRNVGNYGTQWDGLRFQTNQLVRELPAMAYGVNVFFGAIGNNLPMFIDEVNKAREAQRLAIAEGKTAPSVISRITGALFNWQTALVIGLTFLTLYGRELFNWIKGIGSVSDELEKLTAKQRESEKAWRELISGRQSRDITTLLTLTESIKNNRLSLQERTKVVKDLQEMYPSYLKNLTTENINTKEIQKALEQLNKDLIQRSVMMASEDKIREIVAKKIENQKRGEQELLKIEKEREKVSKEMPKGDPFADENSSAFKAYQKRFDALYRLQANENILKTRIDDKNKLLQDELDYYLKLFNQNAIYIEASVKGRSKQEKSNYDYIDSLASEYELMKLLYEIEIKRNKNIFEDEKATYSERGKAMKEMYDNQLALIKLTRDEEIRLLDLEKSKNLEEVKNATDKNRAIYEIEQDYSNKLSIIRQNYSKQETEINNEIAKSYDVIIKKLWEYNSLINGISKGQLEDRGKELEFLSGLKFGEATKGLEQFNKNIQELASAEKIGKISLELAKAEEELNNLDPKSDDYQKWLSEVIRLQRELQEETINTTKKTKEELAKLEQDYKKFVQGFQNEVLNVLPSLQTLLSDDFQNMISGLFEEGLDRQALMAVAVQVTEVFQDMYNLMQKNSDAYYERQFETLEMQKDVAIRFAGDSAVAREEIERQYEQKRRKIERERAKQQKETAIFNATIDLAQGIMATIGQFGFPAAIPMIALLSALGAVQIGMIASQPLPAYAEGTLNHIGGSMLVNDGKGTNYRETIVTPDGKIIRPSGRNVVMDAPKGTQVFTHDQWQQRIGNILNGDKNRYSSPVNKGITKEDLKELLLAQSSNQSERFEVNIDKQGINTTIVRGSMRVKKLNNRIRIKSNN